MAIKEMLTLQPQHLNLVCPLCQWMIREGGTCMRCNNKGQASAGEIILIVVLLTIICAVGYYEITKKNQTNTFKDHSQSIAPSPSVHFGGCSIIKEYIYADPIDKNINK